MSVEIKDIIKEIKQLPHLATKGAWDEDVYEFWHENRKLTFHVYPNEYPECLMVWGPDIETEMKDIRVLDTESCKKLFKWLYCD